MMIPFLESTGGRSQEAKMLVEVWEATVKLKGAKEGTRKNTKCYFSTRQQTYQLSYKQRRTKRYNAVDQNNIMATTKYRKTMQSESIWNRSNEQLDTSTGQKL